MGVLNVVVGGSPGHPLPSRFSPIVRCHSVPNNLGSPIKSSEPALSHRQVKAKYVPVIPPKVCGLGKP